MALRVDVRVYANRDPRGAAVARGNRLDAAQLARVVGCGRAREAVHSVYRILTGSASMPADQPRGPLSASSASSQGDAIETLIQRCLNGDQAAWDLIVRQYWRKVFNVAYKFVGRHDEAEDLTQEIFLKIFKSLDTFDRRANFQTWLISVSRNLCIDHYRSVRKEREP